MPTGYTAYIEDGEITTGKEFLKLWVQKESLIKLEGKTIATNLKTVLKNKNNYNFTFFEYEDFEICVCQKNKQTKTLSNESVFFVYHLLTTFSAKPKKSLISSFEPSSKIIVPENFPNT